MLLGDFNEVLLPSESRGGSFTYSRAEKFVVLLDNYALLDLGAIDQKFT